MFVLRNALMPSDKRTSDISHTDQLSSVLRCVVDGEPIERFFTFLELQSHTGEDMAKQVLQYLREVCKY